MQSHRCQVRYISGDNSRISASNLNRTALARRSSSAVPRGKRAMMMANQRSSQDALVADAVVWASTHGLCVGLGGKDFVHPEVAIIHAPISLRPVAFPRERFLQAKASMKLFNDLTDRISEDEEYLEETLRSTAESDEFTRRLLGILKGSRESRKKLRAEGRDVVLGIHRSDYMLDEPSGTFLQVELNTVASSFGCLSSLTTRLHRYILRKEGVKDLSNLPDNPAITEIPAALSEAHKASGIQDGVICMVVQPGERNAYDQQWLQMGLFEEHGLTTIRRSMAEIQAKGKIRESDGALMVEGEQEGTLVPVSVVYFRAGYTPDDYPTEKEWMARELVESCSSAKCPSVAYQLAGSKKVQQDLARPGVLERFMSTEAEASQLREMFAGLWGLDDPSDPDTAAIIQKAMEQPHAFVMKPQREGGGNNLYGEDLVARLKEGTGLSAYILMQKILPPAQKSVLVRQGKWVEVESLSELGIYSTYVKKGDRVVVNKEAGHLVRTKGSDSNEGGVNAGFAVLDSPILV